MILLSKHIKDIDHLKLLLKENLTKSEMQTLLIEMFAYDAAIATRPFKIMKKYLFQKISAVDNPNVFQWDYLDSIQEQMECDEYGFYHSCKKPISLMQKKRKKTVLVQGWDLGNGNVLSCS